MSGVFDLDAFLAACQDAAHESEPRLATREVLSRAMSTPGDVATALAPQSGGLALLHHADDLTVVHAIWPPGIELYPHDHRMWAAIGIYAGQEDNAFYRRAGTTLTPSGGKQLDVGDSVLLGDDTIHSVSNPSSRLTAAIHVYGGDFVNQLRSQWGPGAAEERPFDLDEAMRVFDEANDRWLNPT
jgi:predicted metal-dependent enzyme (double-stranded beta helix superfamily)